MKFWVLAATVLVVGSLSQTARAQESKAVRLVVEATAATSGVPTLVAQEDVVKPQPAATSSTTMRVAKKGEVSVPPQKELSYTSKPVVLSGINAGSYSLSDTTGNPDYDKLALEAGARNGVDPGLIIAVMRQESGFNSRARSYRGATGLMQLMPATARRFGVSNIYDPKQNVEGGARYLRFLLDKFNDDVPLALAGYNAGENAVVDAGYQIPRFRETRNYVRSIAARYGSSGAVVRQAPGKQVASAPMVTGSSNCLSNNY